MEEKLFNSKHLTIVKTSQGEPVSKEEKNTGTVPHLHGEKNEYRITIIHQGKKSLIYCLRDDFLSEKETENTINIYPETEYMQHTVLQQLNDTIKEDLEPAISHFGKGKKQEVIDLFTQYPAIPNPFGTLKPRHELAQKERDTHHETIKTNLPILQEKTPALLTEFLSLQKAYSKQYNILSHERRKLTSMKTRERDIEKKLESISQADVTSMLLAQDYVDIEHMLEAENQRLTAAKKNLPTLSGKITKLQNRLDFIGSDPDPDELSQSQRKKYDTLHDKIKQGTISVSHINDEIQKLKTTKQKTIDTIHTIEDSIVALQNMLQDAYKRFIAHDQEAITHLQEAQKHNTTHNEYQEHYNKQLARYHEQALLTQSLLTLRRKVHKKPNTVDIRSLANEKQTVYEEALTLHHAIEQNNQIIHQLAKELKKIKKLHNIGSNNLDKHKKSADIYDKKSNLVLDNNKLENQINKIYNEQMRQLTQINTIMLDYRTESNEAKNQENVSKKKVLRHIAHLERIAGFKVETLSKKDSYYDERIPEIQELVEKEDQKLQDIIASIVNAFLLSDIEQYNQRTIDTGEALYKMDNVIVDLNKKERRAGYEDAAGYKKTLSNINEQLIQIYLVLKEIIGERIDVDGFFPQLTQANKKIQLLNLINEITTIQYELEENHAFTARRKEQIEKKPNKQYEKEIVAAYKKITKLEETLQKSVAQREALSLGFSMDYPTYPSPEHV